MFIDLFWILKRCLKCTFSILQLYTCKWDRDKVFLWGLNLIIINYAPHFTCTLYRYIIGLLCMLKVVALWAAGFLGSCTNFLITLYTFCKSFDKTNKLLTYFVTAYVNFDSEFLAGSYFILQIVIVIKIISDEQWDYFLDYVIVNFLKLRCLNFDTWNGSSSSFQKEKMVSNCFF